MLQVWPYLLGVYRLDSTSDTCRTQDDEARRHYEKLTADWRVAETVARKREQENAAPDVPPPNLSLSENHEHAAKMAFYRKDSSLSNDVFFESLDAPVETFRPETVVEETSSVTSLTTEAAGESEEHACTTEADSVHSLPVRAGT